MTETKGNDRYKNASISELGSLRATWTQNLEYGSGITQNVDLEDALFYQDNSERIFCHWNKSLMIERFQKVEIDTK